MTDTIHLPTRDRVLELFDYDPDFDKAPHGPDVHCHGMTDFECRRLEWEGT